MIYIEGRLQTRTYKDKENIQRRITEIVSTTITPLEWKTMDKKGNVSANKVDNKDDNNTTKPAVDEDLPF